MVDVKSIKKIHFIGIGGIGMSALARMMLHEGKQVSGSDSEETENIQKLRTEGALVTTGHHESHIPDGTDMVVYTIAVSEQNPEMRKAKSLGIPLLSYPEMLGIVSEGKFTIAVSGTHGKTTTTAMIAKILSVGDYSPTVIVGSLLKEGGSNFVPGDGNIFLVEACEYRRSFLHLSPNILVITNIDDDHLDYYKDMYDIQSAFSTLAHKVGKGNHVVTNPKNPFIAPALIGVKAKIHDYTDFNEALLKLKVPGNHNISNAKAAMTVAEILNVRLPVALQVLHDFKGTWRRFEYKGKMENGAEFYDDYAHHPTEIKATLAGARTLFPKRKIFVVFQPHLYSRTKLLLDAFAKSFDDADEVVIAPIYAAREDEQKDVNSWILAEKIRAHKSHVTPLYNFKEIEEFLRKRTGEKDIVITMGAGDIYKVADSLAAS